MGEAPLRSVSQINQYLRCPQAYKLGRIDKVWSRPAAWLPQGTAFHAVAEGYERSLSSGDPMSLEQAQQLFCREYAKEVSALTDETPNLDWWFWSGPYAGGRDLERRWDIGLEQVEKFVAWRSLEGQQIWTTPGGEPAIELAFVVDLDGIAVRGFIDAVVVVDGELRVRDYKTGNAPGDDFQLAVYAHAVGLTYNIAPPKTGDYYMAGKRGKPAALTKPYDLTVWSLEGITRIFHEVEARIQAGEFDPDPEPQKCNFCDVNLSCPVFNQQT